MQRLTPPYIQGLFFIFTWVTGGLILSLPTLINGFPFLYYDSGYYLLFGTFKVEPWLIIWRPIIYGLFSGTFLAWGGHLSCFVIVQNLVLSLMLLFFCKNLLKHHYQHWIFLAVITALFLTPLPWISNFVLPDFFSGLVPLLFAALLLEKNLLAKWLLALATLCSLIMHHSNMITSVLLLPMLWLKYGHTTLRRVLIATLILPWLLVPFIHGLKTQSFSLSNASHAILFSRFMAMEVAQKYLADFCFEKKQPHTLCRYHTERFDLWQWANKTYEKRSLENLTNSTDNFREINWGILSSKYLFIYLWHGLENSMKQVFSSSKPLKAPNKSSLVEKEVRTLHLKNHIGYNHQEMPLGFPEKWEPVLESVFNCTAMSSLLLLLLLFVSGHMERKAQTYLTVSLLYYLANGFTIGLFTDPMPRYSIRISWVFFFLLLLQAGILLQKSKEVYRSRH